MSEIEPDRVEAVAKAVREATERKFHLLIRSWPECKAIALAALRADEAYRREQRQRHMAEAEFRERPERNRIIEGMETAVDHAKGDESKARVTTIIGPERPRGLPGTFNGA